jgi:hypothetical protein
MLLVESFINRFLITCLFRSSLCIFDGTAGELGELSGRPLVVTITCVIVNDGYKLVDISLIEKRFVTTTDNYSA